MLQFEYEDVTLLCKQVAPSRKQAPDTTTALAEHLGLSRWTVSRVLNGHTDVKDSTIRRVKKAVEELGFQPNALARGLRGGSTRTIGVCFQDLDSPILSVRAGTLQQLLRDEDYTAVMELSDANLELEEAAVKRFVSLRVDGVVLVFSDLTEDNPAIRLLRSSGVPCLWVDPKNNVSGPRVALDRATSMRLVLEHLTKLGHRRLAVLGIDPDEPFGALRMPGLKKYAPRCGLDFARDLTFFFTPEVRRHTYEYGHTLAGQLLEKQKPLPSALIAINDRVAIGATTRLREAGLRVPEDISIVGHDNLDVSRYYNPTLTTLDQQTDKLMRTAVEQLLAMLDAPEPTAEPQHRPAVMVLPRLVTRQSTVPTRVS